MEVYKFYTAVNPLTAKVIQLWAFENGYKWVDGSGLSEIDSEYIIFGLDGRQKTLWTSDRREHENSPLLSFEDALDRIEEKDIEIGEYTVVFKQNHLEIGCQTIPNSIVREIERKLCTNSV